MGTEIIDLPFKSDEFYNIWQEWLEFRKERKYPKYGPIGLKRALSRLIRLSSGFEATATAIIIQSMEMGWQGFFPIKIEQNGTTKLGTSAARIEALRNW